MFTVLTWSWNFVEISLAICDCGRRVDLAMLRELKVLFGLASLEAPDPDRTGNPLGILNIERIRDYCEARASRPLSATDMHRTNLGYGIRPHCGSALRGFGLIGVNNCSNYEDELHTLILPGKEDRK